MGDLRSPPMVRVRDNNGEAEETRISTKGTKPAPPMRTTSLKTVTVGVTNEILARDPSQIPVEGTIVQRWSSEQNPDPAISRPERPSSSNAVLESWFNSNNLSADQEIVYENAVQATNCRRESNSDPSPTLNGFASPVVENVVSNNILPTKKTSGQGLSANLSPGLRSALISRLESCLIDLGSPADNMTLARWGSNQT